MPGNGPTLGSQMVTWSTQQQIAFLLVMHLLDYDIGCDCQIHISGEQGRRSSHVFSYWHDVDLLDVLNPSGLEKDFVNREISVVKFQLGITASLWIVSYSGGLWRTAAVHQWRDEMQPTWLPGIPEWSGAGIDSSALHLHLWNPWIQSLDWVSWHLGQEYYKLGMLLPDPHN